MQIPLLAHREPRGRRRSCHGLGAALALALKDKCTEQKCRRRGQPALERDSGATCNRRPCVGRDGGCRPWLLAAPRLPRFPHLHREMDIRARSARGSFLLEFVSPGTVGGSVEQGRQRGCCGEFAFQRENGDSKERNRQDNFKQVLM